jgi:hypothetical protein
VGLKSLKSLNLTNGYPNKKKKKKKKKKKNNNNNKVKSKPLELFELAGKNKSPCIFIRPPNEWGKAAQVSYKLINLPVDIRLSPPPFNLTIFKGFRENLISRQSAIFFTQTMLGKEFLKWLARTGCPEEFFFATLTRVSKDDYYFNNKIVQGKKHFKILLL